MTDKDDIKINEKMKNIKIYLVFVHLFIYTNCGNYKKDTKNYDNVGIPSAPKTQLDTIYEEDSSGNIITKVIMNIDTLGNQKK